MTAPSSRYDLVAVMSRDAALTLPSDLDLTVAAEGALALVVAPPAEPLGLSALLTGAARRRAAERIAARQRLLERLQEAGDVLPARPGQTLPSERLRPALAANHDALAEALAAVAGLAQYQITVRWRPAEALRRFAKEPELDGLAEPRAIAHGAEALRLRLGTTIVARVAPCTIDHVPLPLDPGPDMLANLAALTPRGGSATLDAALESIDAIWTEGLSIRMIGPLPAVSFAAFELVAPGPEAAAARRALGLQPTVGASAVRAAFRARAGEATDGATLTDAADLLRRLALAQAAAADHPPLGDDLPLARFLRDGDVARRAPAPSPDRRETAA